MTRNDKFTLWNYLLPFQCSILWGEDSVCAWLAINLVKQCTRHDSDIQYFLKATLLRNEMVSMGHRRCPFLICRNHCLTLTACVFKWYTDIFFPLLYIKIVSQIIIKKIYPLPPKKEYLRNIVMVNSEFGNQMCLLITSNSSTRAFNEITSLNEHRERVKSEQWLFRVV